MKKPTSYYIASSLENVEQVRQVKTKLDAAGWRHTYDWTVHGSVQSAGMGRIIEVASNESVGVFEADVLVVLLPGGRGTHSELDMQIGKMDVLSYLHLKGIVTDPLEYSRICIYSPDPTKDFSTSGGTTCAFYYHPYAERFSGDLNAAVDFIIQGRKAYDAEQQGEQP